MAKSGTRTDSETVSSSSSLSSWPLLEKTGLLDKPLLAIGFVIEAISPTVVTGRLKITETCCQPFGVFHGGVSALIAEALASIGATVASGFQRVAGVQLTINHLKPAQLGDHIFAQATPISVGRTIQVWEVGIWKIDPGSSEDKGAMIATSRLTVVTNIKSNSSIVKKKTENHTAVLKKLAKL